MGPGRILFLVFMIVPLIEIAFFVVIGNAIGLWPTLAGVLVTAIVGSLVLRYQGMAVFNDIRGQMGRGQIPGRALADAALIGAGGLMLLLPGYFSDLVGILLLLPPTRAAIYAFLKSRIQVVSMTGSAGFSSPQREPDRPGVIDLDHDDYRPR
jgi:UPF0716 protein FxsA